MTSTDSTLDSTAIRRDALGILMPGFAGPTLPDWFADLLRDGLGGVCLFGQNIESPAQVAALTAAIYAANPHAIIATDEEGGDVSRLHQHDGSPFPGNAVLGRIDDLDVTRTVGHEVGAQLANAGIRLALAPVADINCNPHNPVIGVRSFGADAASVAAHTATWTEGVQAAGVAACAKHFPGHGDTSADSHVAEPVVTADAATFAARELEPFRAAIAAGTKTIITSHIRVPALDPDAVATFSSAILGDLLRGELGFDGVVVTDALDMVGASGQCGIPAAAVAAVAAGSDLLCLGQETSASEIDAIVGALAVAIEAADLPRERLADAAARCDGLARWTTEQRHRTDASPAVAATEPVVSLDTIAASFAVSDRAAALLGSGPREVRWVRIDPEPNVAIGETPFGPFFDGGAVASLVVPVADRGVADTWAEAHVAGPGVVTVVVGREFHRDPGAAAAATAITAVGDTIVVDMGFAESDGVDIATFGASRLVGEALLELVGASA